MGRKSALFLAWVAVAWLLAGCIELGGGDNCSDGAVILQDDFSGEQNCGWIEWSNNGISVGISEGFMQISTSQPGQFGWTNPGLTTASDVIVTTQARQVSGPDDNAYGVICRYQDEQNFYIFLVSGDGFYAIGKYQTGSDQIEYLTENNQFVYSDVINQGVATNEIRASCIGNELSLAINGISVVAVSDPTFVRGDVGLGVSTFVPGTAVIQFDDVRILAP